MRTPAVLGAALVLAACSRSESAPPPPTDTVCTRAFAHVLGVGSLTAQDDDPARLALAFGIACHDFTDADRTCIANATDTKTLGACQHAAAAIGDRYMALLRYAKRDPASMSPYESDRVGTLQHAVCPCRDTGCMVAAGERAHDAVAAWLASPPATAAGDVAAERQLGACMAQLHDLKPAAPSSGGRATTSP